MKLYIRTTHGPDHSCEHAEAYALLVAAAPELLSACQIALVRLEGGSKKEQEFNKGVANVLRKALAKAEGR